VLENHHVATLYRIITTPKTSILEQVQEEQYRRIRKNCINNILKTDMKEHFALIKGIQEKRNLYKDEFLKKIAENEADQLLYTGFLTHCADLCGPVKPFHIASEWSKRISKEFSRQVEHILSCAS
jgi:hypothetical protein